MKLYRYHSDYRISRDVTCKYCKTKFKSVKLKRLFCSDECAANWDDMISKFKGYENVLYLLGYEANNKYYIKIEISEKFDNRFLKYSTATPFLLNVYQLIHFRTNEQAKSAAKLLHLKTIDKQTEAHNEWREFKHDELANIMIEISQMEGGTIIKEHVTY